jgi:putative ABC transport system permease protein
MINILGLSAGIAAFLFITTYVRFEKSYESYNPNADNTWRITLDVYNGSEYLLTDCETHPLMGSILKERFPEVVDYVRMYDYDGLRHIQVGEKKFVEGGVYFADASAFNILAIEVLQGDPLKTWNEPLQMAISESQAKKFFGRTDVVGEHVSIDGDLFKITGVIADPRPNTHLKFSTILTHETLKRVKPWYNDENVWNGNNEFTYLLMQPGTDLAAFNEKLLVVCQELKDKLHEGKYRAEPIKSIHLYSAKSFEPEVNGSAKVVSFLAIIALFIIGIAWVNYMNLATARAVERAREVGIRKVMGSLKSQLITQFLSESFIVNLMAGFIGLALFELAMPLFKALTGLPDAVGVINDISFWMVFGGLVFIGSMLAGIYPAFVLSSFKPVDVLKGQFQSSSHGQLLRKSLVVFQFATTMILIIGVTTVYMQINHMRSVDIGANLDQTVAVRMPLLDVKDSVYAGMVGPLKTEMLRNPAIKSVTMTHAMPGIPSSEMNTTMLAEVGREKAGEYEYTWFEIDENFVSTMGMTIVAGRDFKTSKEDGNVLINEEAAKLFGFASAEDAVGRRINFWDWRTKGHSTIVGVIKNFYQRSPKEAHLPMIFRHNFRGRYFTAHLETTDVSGTITSIKETWEKVFPGEPFTYFFVDERFDQQYRSDVQFGQVMGTFSVLAVIIACLGLFGLSSYTIIQRRKEIGIRKVLGASVSQVVRLLSGGYVKIIIIASLVALPIAWYTADNWLAGYSVRISLNTWMFAAPVLFILATALLTVSFQTIRSALLNPAKSLKDE